MGAYQALKELIDYKSKSMQEIIYDNYYFKCGERMLAQQEYDISSEESSVLHELYFLYRMKLNNTTDIVEMKDIFTKQRSIKFQRDFYTKLFIYDKISQIEKENGIDVGISSMIYYDYVVELNTTTNIEGEQSPKRAMDIFQDFAREELKQDKEFLNTINTFCDNKIEMIFSGSEEDISPISFLCPTEKIEGNPVEETEAIIIDFCKIKRDHKKN